MSVLCAHASSLLSSSSSAVFMFGLFYLRTPSDIANPAAEPSRHALEDDNAHG